MRSHRNDTLQEGFPGGEGRSMRNTWGVFSDCKSRGVIFSQEASAESLLAEVKEAQRFCLALLCWTSSLRVYLNFRISPRQPDHTHSHTGSVRLHVLLHSHTWALPLTFTHLHCPSHSRPRSTTLPLLCQQRDLNPIGIKNSCSKFPFKKIFNCQQMDYGLDIYILRGFQLQ